MRGIIRSFLTDESGAVTVDWVVLTAAIVTLTVFAIPPVRNGLQDVSASIGTYLTDYSGTMPDSPDLNPVP